MADFDPQAYLAGAQPANAGFDPAAYLAGPQAPQSQTPIKDAALGTLGVVAKGLGYAGGLARTGALEMTGQAEDGDAARALKGNAVTTAEYLQRKGVPEGAKLSDVVPGYAEPGNGNWLRPQKGGMLDPSARGAAGFVGDVALDPLTYLSGGLSAAAKEGAESTLLKKLLLQNADNSLSTAGKVANVAANPIESMSRSGATNAYAKAFEKVDSKFPDKPQSLAQIAQATGFKGDAAAYSDHIMQINNKAGVAIGDTLKEAAAKGASVDLDTVLQPALDAAKKYRAMGTPEASVLADQIESRVKMLQDSHVQTAINKTAAVPGVPAQYEHEMYSGQKLVPGTGTPGTPELTTTTRLGSTLPVDQANAVKSELNSYTNFNPSDTEAVANRGRKAVAGALSGGIKESVGNTDQELLDRLLKQNDLYSSTSPQVQKKLEQFSNQAPQQRGAFGGSQVDGILSGVAGGGVLAGNPMAALPLAGKKAAQALQSVQGLTTKGYYLNKVGAGSNGMTDAITREALDEMMKQQMEKNKK
jgi:hypothetical protein